jgi:hypothetical protein
MAVKKVDRTSGIRKDKVYLAAGDGTKSQLAESGWGAGCSLLDA